MNNAISPRRARELLWADLRLVVVDIETVMDEQGFRGSPRDEVDRAIDAVQEHGQPVRLAPQPRAIRRQQHATAEAAGLTSESSGVEPARSVEVRPRIAEPATEVRPVRGGEHRAVSIAVVACERGRAGQPWHRLVNPGVPVDPLTFDVHGLDDELLQKAPALSLVADELLALLSPVDGETLVLVAHNAGFDLGVLRAEFRRVGLRLPEIAVLDTMGPLAALVGVAPTGRSLPDLLVALGLVNTAHHRADADAVATAAAACALLERAAVDHGLFDMAALLAELGAARRPPRSGPTGRVRPRRRPVHGRS